MRFRLFSRSCAAGAVLTLAALSAPAFAHDHRHHPGDMPYGPDMRPDWRGDGQGYAMMDPRSRDMWLDDCHHRVAERGAPAEGACERALDDFFASGPGYGYQPTIMVPVTIPGKPCVETVTTSYAPARRVIPRRPAPRPDKRIRIAPDKRIPVK
jgi:hypothetical protein